MFRHFLTLTIFASVMGCGTSSQLIHSSDKNVSLITVPIVSPESALAKNAPSVLVTGKKDQEVPAKGTAEEKVWEECGYTPPATGEGSERFAIPVVLVGLAVDYAFDALSKKISDEIAQYQASFAVTGSMSFYNINNGAVQPTVSCLRFSRYEPDSTGHQQVVFDLIVHLIPGVDSMQIVPLRLYYGKAKAQTITKTVKGKTTENVSLAVTLAGTAIWKQRNEGMTSQLFSAPLLSLTCDFSKGSPIWYASSMLPKAEASQPQACASHSNGATNGSTVASSGIIAPVPPYSIDLDNSIVGPGRLQITATAAEVGTPPELLCKLASVLKSEKSTAESALSKAIDEKLGFEQSTSSSGSKGGGKSSDSSGDSGNAGGQNNDKSSSADNTGSTDKSTGAGNKSGSSSSSTSTACGT